MRRPLPNDFVDCDPDTPIVDMLRRRTHDLIAQIEDKLIGHKTTTTLLWTYIYKRFNVEQADDITAEDYQTIIAGLIRARDDDNALTLLIEAMKASENPTPTPPTPATPMPKVKNDFSIQHSEAFPNYYLSPKEANQRITDLRAQIRWEDKVEREGIGDLHEETEKANQRRDAEHPGPAPHTDTPTTPRKTGIQIAFAIIGRYDDHFSLNARLYRQGIAEKFLWNYLRRRFNVTSRKDIGERDWTVINAELNAAKSDKTLFRELAARIAEDHDTELARIKERRTQESAQA